MKSFYVRISYVILIHKYAFMSCCPVTIKVRYSSLIFNRTISLMKKENCAFTTFAETKKKAL